MLPANTRGLSQTCSHPLCMKTVNFLSVRVSICSLLISMLLLPWHTMWAQSARQYEYGLEIAERYYEEGEYRKALEQADKLLKRLAGSDMGYLLTRLQMQRARYLAVLGGKADFESVVNRVLELKRSTGKHSILHGKALLDAANAYWLLTDYVTAQNYLDSCAHVFYPAGTAPGTPRADGKWDPSLDFLFLSIQANLYLAKGDFDQAFQLTDSLLPLGRERMVGGREALNETTGQFETFFPDRFQQRRIRREYAEALTLRGKIARMRGQFEQADSLLNQAGEWIKQELSNRDFAFARNRHQQALLMIESGQAVEEGQKIMEKNIFLTERLVGTVHRNYLEMHEDMIRHYVSSRYLRRSRIQQWEMNTNTGRYYGKDNVMNVAALRMDALRDGALDENERALEKLQKVEQAPQILPAFHQENLLVHEQLYHTSLSADRYQEALTYLNRYRGLISNTLGKQSLAYHLSNLKLANYLTSFTNQFKQADSLYKVSYEWVTTRLAVGHPYRLELARQYADYHMANGQYEMARQVLSPLTADARQRFGENAIRYAIALEPIASVNLSSGRYLQADSMVNQMLDIFTKQTYRRRQFDVGYARVLETSARYYALMGLYQEANRQLTLAGRLNQRSASSIANSSAIDELAYLYIRTERYAESARLLDEALRIRKARYGEESRFLITPYNQLARLAYINGDYLAADELVEKALSIATTTFGDSSLAVTESYAIKGDINTAIGDYEKASDFIQATIRIKTKLLGEQHLDLANAYTQLAISQFYSQKASPEQVIGLMEKSVALIRKNLGESSPVYAEGLRNLTLVSLQHASPEVLRRQLAQATQIWNARLGTPRNTNAAEIMLIEGDLALQENKPSEAIAAYQRASRIFEQIFNKQHPQFIKAQSRTARAHFVSKDYNRAERLITPVLNNHLAFIRQFFPALSSREQTRYWLLVKNDFDFFHNLAVANQAKRPELTARMYDYALLTKSILINNSQRMRNNILSSGDSSLIRTFNLWVEKKELLTKALSLPAEQQKEQSLEPGKLGKEIETLEKDLSRRSSAFSQATATARPEKKARWKQVQETLKSGEAAVELLRFNHFGNSFTDSVVYVALMLTPKTTRSPMLLSIPEGNQLETRALPFYRTCIEFDLDDDRSYNSFWAAIGTQLTPGMRVYLSSDGVYNQINLETLMTPEGDYLLDRTDLRLVTSTEELLTGRAEVSTGTAPGSIVLVGNPVFYKDLAEDEFNQYTQRAITQLPGTMEEIQQIQDLVSEKSKLKVRTYVNLEATEDALKAMKSPKVFHIATHGFFLEDENISTDNELAQNRVVAGPLLRSGLLLRYAGELMKEGNVYAFNRESGVLTAYEAMNLNLDQTELVVLSACETGRGETKVGEGVYGLQRSLMVAGAQQIIMSLFEVSDEATQKMMTFFYRNWLEKNMEIRDAFKTAKVQVREEFPEVRYWGPFILTGGI